MTLQGAGMWHTTFVGDAALYNGGGDRRVGLMGGGNNIHLNDFAITGSLDHRTDTDNNDGIGGFFGTGSSISGLWIEHTKVGMWIKDTSGMSIADNRVRDTLADGINLYRSAQYVTVSNTATRNTGDDGLAMFPAYTSTQPYAPGHNVFTGNTVVAPYRANGIAIYGGDSNLTSNNLVQDVNYGSGVLVSTTFSGQTTAANNFSGTTVVCDSVLVRTGGPETKAAILIAPTGLPISGVSLINLSLVDNPQHGLGVHGTKALTNANATGLQIGTVGLATPLSYGVWIESTVPASTMSISNSAIGEYHNEATAFKLTLTSVTGALPSPWVAGDINTLSASTRGATTYPAGAFTVTGAGTGIRSAADGFRFVSQNVTGDRTLIASVSNLTGNTPTAGLMFRDDTSAGSANVGVFVTSTGTVVLQSRSTAGGTTTTAKTISNVRAPVQLRLVRAGNAFTAYYNLTGTWVLVGTVNVALAAASNAGLAVTSGNKSLTGTATFGNVGVA